MRARLSRRFPLLLLLVGALACADAATAPGASTARPSLARIDLSDPGALRAAVRVLSVTDLGNIGYPFDHTSEAWRINDAGQVVGVNSPVGIRASFERYETADSAAPTLWRSGVFSLLTVPARRYMVTGITDGGTVTTGVAYPDPVGLWNGSFTRLADAPGGCFVLAVTDANDAGVASGILHCDGFGPVVGVRLPGGPWQAYWRTTATPWYGENFPGGFAVNRGGDVAGAVPTADARTVVPVLFSTSAGVVPHILDCRPTCYRGWARDVNDRQWLVGTLSWAPSGGAAGAFVWTPAGGFERIPLLPGDTHSAAFGINRWNQVVGYSWAADRRPRAFLWTRRGGTQPLAPLVAGTGSKAYGINDRGQVVGTSGQFEYGRPFEPGRTSAVMWRLDSPILSVAAGGPISLTATGTLRVAILGGPGINPLEIDPASLRLGDEVRIDTPSARDASGLPLASAADVNGDGYPDLVVEFSIPTLVGNGDVTGRTTALLLTGFTRQGVQLMGEARVTVVP